MSDIEFGLWLALVGMSVVFGLLLVVMGVLLLLRRFDRPEPEPESGCGSGKASGVTDAAATQGVVIALPAGQGGSADLTPDEVAAVSVAVLTHARVRRMQAAPAMRVHEPGSHLYASRWVAIGRGYQNQPWRRDK